ncbi:MAG: hypothetical protein J0H14_07520 [Alphaproteobacteria bacterium]|nr:hypothetical protein [Alphaproteobacteria bacterium]
MTEKFWNYGVALGLALFTAVPAYAQSSSSQSPPGHAMPGMDMGSMTKQCGQMRRQMQSGSKMTPDMQRMMTQCDDMDAQMNNSSGNPSGTRQRTR